MMASTTKEQTREEELKQKFRDAYDVAESAAKAGAFEAMRKGKEKEEATEEAYASALVAYRKLWKKIYEEKEKDLLQPDSSSTFEEEFTAVCEEVLKLEGRLKQLVLRAKHHGHILFIGHIQSYLKKINDIGFEMTEETCSMHARVEQDDAERRAFKDFHGAHYFDVKTAEDRKKRAKKE